MRTSKAYMAIILLLSISCDPGTHEELKYRVVYKNDKEGNTLVGSKEALIQYIRGGADVRIGWGGKGKSHTIEHLSEPIWIAVLDGSEVIAHLDPQILARTDWDNLTADYSDSTLLRQEWRVVITTKGEFDAVWYDRYDGRVVKRRPQNHIISWFAKGKASNQPLFAVEKNKAP